MYLDMDEQKMNKCGLLISDTRISYNMEMIGVGTRGRGGSTQYLGTEVVVVLSPGRTFNDCNVRRRKVIRQKLFPISA